MCVCVCGVEGGRLGPGAVTVQCFVVSRADVMPSPVSIPLAGRDDCCGFQRGLASTSRSFVRPGILFI